MSYPLRLRQIDPNPLNPFEPLVEVSLERTALPERALAERMGLKISKEFYPGAPEPVVQILNRELKPITLKGKFSDFSERTSGFTDAAVAVNRGDAFRVANRAAQALAEAEVAFEALPPDIIEPPPEWESDPWMMIRPGFEEVQKRTQAVLDLEAVPQMPDQDQDEFQMKESENPSFCRGAS